MWNEIKRPRWSDSTNQLRLVKAVSEKFQCPNHKILYWVVPNLLIDHRFPSLNQLFPDEGRSCVPSEDDLWEKLLHTRVFPGFMSCMPSENIFGSHTNMIGDNWQSGGRFKLETQKRGRNSRKGSWVTRQVKWFDTKTHPVHWTAQIRFFWACKPQKVGSGDLDCGLGTWYCRGSLRC